MDGTFGEGIGLILLDDVHCEGTETSLLDCQHGIWGRTDCSHSEDVGVRCRGQPSQETNEVPVIAPSAGKRRGLRVAGELTAHPTWKLPQSDQLLCNEAPSPIYLSSSALKLAITDHSLSSPTFRPQSNNVNSI